MSRFNKFLSGLFKYCGGKKRLLKRLIEIFLLLNSKVFIDFFGGAGTVTANFCADIRVINEKKTDIAIIFKALSKKKYADVFTNILYFRFRYSDYRLYKKAWEYLKAHEDYTLEDYSDDELPLAAAYSWLVHFFSRVGNKVDNKPKFTAEKLNRWYKFVDSGVCDYIEAFNGVIVWSMDIFDAIERAIVEFSGFSSTWYGDPPYLSARNSSIKTDLKTYAKNSSNRECTLGADRQINMMERLNLLPSSFKVVVSNYDNEPYNNFVRRHKGKWRKLFLEELPIMCGNGSLCGTQGRNTAREYIYINF